MVQDSPLIREYWKCRCRFNFWAETKLCSKQVFLFLALRPPVTGPWSSFLFPQSYFFTAPGITTFLRPRPRGRFDEPSLSYFLRAPALITFFTSLDPITILRLWPQFRIIRLKNSCQMKMFLLCCAFRNILNRQNPLEKN